ncbi:hypothetical protein BN946_scf184979.g50 [Trametes cinnabarina]|uniref:Uncharacterized protein n=1 Tax=Pycnoporus cinnabarinus TaxID=5643 RepID=A0A060SJB2_PYCCI|nr:hypothetical protein BN946_scf184979.g50 [Trametes cinnabarina]
MPTATATTTSASTSVISLKAASTAQPPPSPSSPSSAAATLRSLYPRAARAFLQRDVPLTHSLISSASPLLTLPTSPYSHNDPLASQRRKWDILRITFETTLYASPPSVQDTEHLPSTLRANLMLSPESLIAALHQRSMQLFTPADPPQPPSSTYLPSQILVTLVLGALKLNCPHIARALIEDWLAKNGQGGFSADADGYVKVLELYCLHVLPRLQDWDYADDFLKYERELPINVREQYVASLRQLRAEALANAHAQTAHPSHSVPSSSTTSRSVSPAPSDSSVSSSSTQTATPRSRGPAANGSIRPMTPFESSQSPKPQEQHRHGSPHSTSSQSIASTATSRTVTPQSASRERDRERARAKKPARAAARLPDGSASRSRSRSATPAATAAAGSPASSASMPNSVIRHAPLADPASARSSSIPRAPSTLALVRASFQSVLRGASRAKILAYLVLFVVLPLVSFLMRVRRRRAVPSGTGGGTVGAVRRRLRAANGQGGTGVVAKVWEELVRAVLDTVRMAGRGLV